MESQGQSSICTEQAKRCTPRIIDERGISSRNTILKTMPRNINEDTKTVGEIRLLSSRRESDYTSQYEQVSASSRIQTISQRSYTECEMNQSSKELLEQSCL